MKDRVTGAVDTARPYVERMAQDEELHEHVKNAYGAARNIYEELLGDRGATGAARRIARDTDLQDELRNAVEELRKAGNRVQGKESHTGRNMTLLLAGIALGILFNPATGPETRRWLKDKVLGPEQPFEYQSNESA
ncbi:MAG: YtxH domain-containing protein [Gaiellaceae bacterium]